MFGKRKELIMPQEPKEPQEKIVNTSRPPRKEVELFPPVVERNNQYLSTPSPQTGITRLGTQISMFQPTSFEEALDVVEALRSRHATTISLEKLKKADAGRLVDFVAGASAALDGDFHKMTEQVFLFCPATIRIVASGKTATTAAESVTTPKASLGLSLDTLFPETQADKNGWGSLWTRPQ